MASENEKYETLADIEADIRDRADCAQRHGDSVTHNEAVAALLLSIADRIEATWKREMTEAEANALAVGGLVEASRHTQGNAAALREALEKVRFYLPYFLQYMRLHWEDAEAGGYYERILEVVNAALSAPARQCDVSTAEEQFVRFRDAMVHECLADEYCRCKDAARCFAQWAQLPYDAKEGAGE